jgi:hypothetical protein
MHPDSAITFRFESTITDAEPMMVNRWPLILFQMQRTLKDLAVRVLDAAGEQGQAENPLERAPTHRFGGCGSTQTAPRPLWPLAGKRQP